MMAEDEDFEILPKNTVRDLKEQLTELKRETGSKKKNDTAADEGVKRLQESIEELIKMFKIATREMKIDEIRQESVEKGLDPLSKKLDTLIQQNQELAEGLVVVADLVKDSIPKLQEQIERLKDDLKTEERPRPLSSPSWQPPAPSLEPMPSEFGAMQRQSAPPTFPPLAPPPEPRKKFGFFSK
jgi:chromosome segregation ATPase